MSKIAFVTDSTAYIPKALLDQYPMIHTIPQVLIWGQETFLDGVDITPSEFYTRLQHATVMPSSSQATPKTFEALYKPLLEKGYEILSVHISSALSGTVDSAVQAKAALGDVPIEIVDSRTTSMAMGFMILEAARAAAQGASLAECKKLVEAALPRTGVLVTVDTLEFLHRGGRIGGVTRYLGTALNIKPIIELVNGRLEPVERVRTRSKAIARLVELLGERTGGNKPLHVTVLHANVESDAQTLLKQIESRFQVIEGYVADVSPVVGTHVGPGTLGITYLIKS
jgi:DegV family protein with EDD domain